MSAVEMVSLVGVILLGAVVGSFLNVVILRLPRGTFFSGGSRSACANPECGQPIRWHDNVPILGWLLLRGRARCCGARISARYPVVEALTAVLFGVLWLAAPGGRVMVEDQVRWAPAAAFGLHAFFISNLIANTFIDIDHRILPDVLTKSAVVVGLLGATLVPGFVEPFDVSGLGPAAGRLLYSGVGALAGYGLTQSIRLSARAVFKRDAMGYGDVKLMAAVGAFVGWQNVLLTFFLGCLLGAVVGIVHRRLTGDAYIFFGPFLAAGAVISLLADDALLGAVASFQHWQQTSPAAPWLALVVAAVSIVSLFVLVRRGRAP